MSSLPPVTVRIKRKATDEPVDFLRVHESNGKRQRRATEFVFSLQAEPVNESTSSPGAAPRGVRRIKSLHRSTSAQVIGTRPFPSDPQTNGVCMLDTRVNESAEIDQPTQSSRANKTIRSALQDATPLNSLSTKQKQPRRFHISRNGSSTPPIQSVSAGRIQKRNTVFVERGTPLKASPTATTTSSPFTPALTPEPEQTSPQKKPGLAARTLTPSNNTPISRPSQLVAQEPRNVRLPSGLIAPWDLTDQQLVDEMQAYTLQEIGHSIAEAEATKSGGSPAPTPSPSKKPSKFRPKIPKLRYHERHPEQFVNQSSETEVEELVEDIDDGSEYVIDTYIRMRADAMDVDGDAEKHVGFLVLDSQSDIEEFYNQDTESDEDEDYDEEDENAENHYTADYPDEEVETDDEYDRNPYKYAHDDAAFSDESGAENKFSWAKKPKWLSKAERGSDDDDEDDDDD